MEDRSILKRTASFTMLFAAIWTLIDLMFVWISHGDPAGDFVVDLLYLPFWWLLKISPDDASNHHVLPFALLNAVIYALPFSIICWSFLTLKAVAKKR